MLNWTSSHSKRAFTLLELMVVVMILSVLAVSAIPLFSRYIRKSKTTEAPLNIRKIYDGQVAYFYEDQVLSSGKVASKRFVFLRPEPPFPPRNEKRVGNFEGAGWPLVKFGADSPLYFVYMADVFPEPIPKPPLLPKCLNHPLSAPPPPPGTFAAVLIQAMGDLDGDQECSLFERTAIVRINTGEITGMPAVFTFDETE